MRFSLQFKYALSYFSIIIVCLAFVCTVPVFRCRDLVLKSKYSYLQNQASLIASSLSMLGELRGDEVRKVMNLLDELGLGRVIVTNEEAMIVYDSADNEGNMGKYVLYPEIVLALSGKNVFFAELRDGAVSGRACIPVMNRALRTGAVYVYEHDTAQAALVEALLRNLVRVSVAVSAAAVLLSLVLSRLMTKRMRGILSGIRGIGAGDYEARVAVRGHDEMSQLSSEINRLADRLQQTETMRQRFVSDASHELKTPLAAIRLLSDSIVQNDGMDRDTVREFVYDIGREAERLSRITQRLLELTRIAAVSKPEKTKVDVRRVVEESLKMLRTLAEERNVHLESRLDEGCCILADADDIHQVVFNLVENAIKYNVPDGRVMVLLFRREDRVFLLVDDTGVGVPEENLSHIFDRFYRVDEARTGGKGGSGLGLSIVQDTVEKHNGTVSARRREGGGMRFEVQFPLWEGAPEKEARA